MRTGVSGRMLWILLLVAAGMAVMSSCASTRGAIMSVPQVPGVQLDKEPAVKLGIEVLLSDKIDLVKGQRVGLVTNSTGVDSRLRATADLLHAHPDVELTALYGPEHGIRGGVQGHLEDSIDTKTGVKVFSLYGKTRKPTKESLENVDVLLFDIQDIGARSYTYISTMKECMDAAAEHGKKIIILDRPNPINGVTVDGNVLDMKFQSFIGIAPISYVHGMTVGELALFFNKELDINCDLEVVTMKGWTRDMTWTDTNLLWTPTSPHIPEPDSALYYPVTGIVGETPLINIGVGYPLPFKIFGAPWMNGEKVAEALNEKGLPGVWFTPFFYRPYYYHYEKQDCSGVRIVVLDHKTYLPTAIDYHIIGVLRQMYPEQFDFDRDEDAKKRHGAIDKANGTDRIRIDFQNGVSAEAIIAGYQADLAAFKVKRQEYLLY